MNGPLALRAAALALAAGGWTGATCGAAEGGPPALPLEVVDVETGAVTPLEAGAAVLHVVVFATWCRPCEDEIPLLAEWEARFGAGGYRLAIVALSERQSRERLLAFLRQRQPPGRLYLDAAGKLERNFGVDAVPAHYLLDASGRVRVRADSLAEIDTATVEELLAERAPVPGEAR